MTPDYDRMIKEQYARKPSDPDVAAAREIVDGFQYLMLLPETERALTNTIATALAAQRAAGAAAERERIKEIACDTCKQTAHVEALEVERGQILEALHNAVEDETVAYAAGAAAERERIILLYKFKNILGTYTCDDCGELWDDPHLDVCVTVRIRAQPVAPPEGPR